MRKTILLLVAMGALIAAFAYWHGATGSPLSTRAIYLLPFIPVAFLFGFALRRTLPEKR